MKSIKIRPLTLSENLNLKVSSVKNIKFDNPEKAKAAIEKIMDFVSKSKDKGIIVAQTLRGQPAAVATNVTTKDGHTFQFPEPNPVLLYFKNACDHLAKSQDLLKELKAIEAIQHELQYHKFLEYFVEVTTGITFLVTSVESFINQHIPENIAYHSIKGKIWSKADIEWKDLKTKIKIIIPAIYNLHFLKTNEKEYSLILEVQDIRDRLVHLKTEHKENKTFYEEIIKCLLDFEPQKYVDAVFLYLNSLQANYIEEI